MLFLGPIRFGGSEQGAKNARRNSSGLRRSTRPDLPGGSFPRSADGIKPSGDATRATRGRALQHCPTAARVVRLAPTAVLSLRQSWRSRLPLSAGRPFAHGIGEALISLTCDTNMHRNRAVANPAQRKSRIGERPGPSLRRAVDEHDSPRCVVSDGALRKINGQTKAGSEGEIRPGSYRTTVLRDAVGGISKCTRTREFSLEVLRSI